MFAFPSRKPPLPQKQATSRKLAPSRKQQKGIPEKYMVFDGIADIADKGYYN